MSTRDRASTLAVAVTTIALIACAAVVVWAATSDRGRDHKGAAAATAGAGATASVEMIERATEPEGIRIYRVWQRRRVAAWADGNAAALRQLYVGRRVARSDVRQLKGWLARGATGVGLTHQVLAYDVERQGEKSLRLRVTHRVAQAVVHSDGPDIALPRGRAVTQVVVLRRSAEEWRVARVRSTR